jgi:hypothetical protein
MLNREGLARSAGRGGDHHAPAQILKWAAAILIGSLFMASAVCRADSGTNQGRIYNEVEAMGISASALPADTSSDGDPGNYVPLDNPFLGTNGECQVPSVPLPAAVWAGLAGGAAVLFKRRRTRV